MGDRLTQLQDAVDELGQQFVACLHFVHTRHNLEILGETDKIREEKKEQGQGEVDPLPKEDFRAGMVELSRDLVLKEQQIEFLISSLPGLANSEKDQESLIKELEDDLKAAEAERMEALKEKDAVLQKLDAVIRSVRRP